MSPDLRTIEGELWMQSGAGVRLVDALSKLPLPTDDLTFQRTFPFGEERGVVRVTPVSDGRYSFYAILPRRYDAAGVVPGAGLFANGLWHPQPMRGDAVQPAWWDAAVALPEGAAGALNNAAGTDTLRWEGEAERLALAAIPGGEARAVPLSAGRLTIVSDRSDARRDARIASLLEESWPGPHAPDMAVVVTPSRRRLARPGPGVLFLSDRAFRVTGRLWRYHRSAVRLGLLEAGLPIPDAWLRSVAAAAIAEAQHAQPSPREALGWFSWIPQIDDLLYDGQLPFFSDVFYEVWPGDPLADDLQEILDPQVPGRAMVHRLDAIYGAGATARLAGALLGGSSLHEATIASGIPPVALEDWRRRPPPQDLSVDVEEVGGEWQIRVARDAPEDAPIEPVAVAIDGQSQAALLGPGPDAATIAQVQEPRRVEVDPAGYLQQTDQSNDAWPERWTAVVAFFPYELALDQGQLSAVLDVAVRRQYDTRWLYGAAAYTDPENRLGAQLSALRYLGPLLDRRYRPVRLWAGVGTALLNPEFRPTDEGAVVLEGFAGAAWDTRQRVFFPRVGHRLSLGLSAGGVPDTAYGWTAAEAGALALIPLGGRASLAGRVKGGLAQGQVEHRLLDLGGADAIQGLPSGARLGQQRAFGALELRVTALRNASIHLPLVWVSDVQLSGGLEAGVLSSDGDPLRASGWTSGAAFVGDVFGASPQMIGAWVAGPLWIDDPALDEGLQIYVRATQAF